MGGADNGERCVTMHSTVRNNQRKIVAQEAKHDSNICSIFLCSFKQAACTPTSAGRSLFRTHAMISSTGYHAANRRRAPCSFCATQPRMPPFVHAERCYSGISQEVNIPTHKPEPPKCQASSHCRQRSNSEHQANDQGGRRCHPL